MWGLRLFHICGDPIHTYVIKCGSFLLLLSHVDLLIGRAEGPTRVEKDSTLLPYLYNQNNRCLSNSIMKGPNRWAQAPSSPVSDPQHRPPQGQLDFTQDFQKRSGALPIPTAKQKQNHKAIAAHTPAGVSTHVGALSHVIACLPELWRPGGLCPWGRGAERPPAVKRGRRMQMLPRGSALL